MITVAGSTGYIGGLLCKRLREDGQEVRALARKPERAGELTEAGCDVVQADVLDPGSLQSALAGAEVAALGRRPPRWAVVPVLTPALSSLWTGLVTPVDAGVARPLVEGLAAETVVTDPCGMELFGDLQPPPLSQALREAARAVAVRL